MFNSMLHIRICKCLGQAQFCSYVCKFSVFISSVQHNTYSWIEMDVCCSIELVKEEVWKLQWYNIEISLV